jgi:hypothetical protein
VEDEELAYESKRSPFGAKYYFGADTASSPTAHRNGNFIRVTIPPDVAENVDKQLDDGIDSTGFVVSSSTYTGTAKINLYYFVD